jgi:hypothetical protein
MGAIGEYGSLLLRINRNCPWNRCLFCSTYKGSRFEYRTTDELKRDIDVVEVLANMVNETYHKLGWLEGWDDEFIQTIISDNPDIYKNISREEYSSKYYSIANVYRWISNGAKDIFIQDADAIIMRTPELIEVLAYLKGKFPTIERVTSYARSKTCLHKSLEELKELHKAGLSRLLVGIESGYDPVLEYMRKGISAEEHIEAGKRVIDSGIKYIAFVMPGLGGRRWSERHISETARILNEIEPPLIRIRSLAIQENSPLYEKWQSGEFEPPTDDQMVDEIELLIENIDYGCDIETGQLTNILFEIKGALPADRERLLGIIRRYKAMPGIDRLKFKLSRYLRYYLHWVREMGMVDSQLIQHINEAEESIELCSPDADEKMERAALTIKQKGIP